MNLLKRLSNLSLSTHVIIALLSGVATGLFFGERVGFLDTVGIAFIKLLQMTVIPYIATSLMLGIGSIPPAGQSSRMCCTGLTISRSTGE